MQGKKRSTFDTLHHFHLPRCKITPQTGMLTKTPPTGRHQQTLKPIRPGRLKKSVVQTTRFEHSRFQTAYIKHGKIFYYISQQEYFQFFKISL